MRRLRLAALVTCLASAAAACGHVPGGAHDDAVGESSVRVAIDATVYDFRATCYDAGAGSVVAIGAGVEPGTGKPTRALVQAFLADSYVGVTVGDREVVYESSLDDVLTLVLREHVIDASNIHFVRDLDLGQGAARPAGDGDVHVDCRSYEPGVPADYTR